MNIKRPARRFSVIIEDGADRQHVLLVRGHDLDGAIKQAVKRLKRRIHAGDIGLFANKAPKRLTLKWAFAGHVRGAVAWEDHNVTNL